MHKICFDNASSLRGRQMIFFACPQCKKGFRVEDNAAGKKTKCPKCGTVITVPAGEQSYFSGSVALPPTAAHSGPAASSPPAGPVAAAETGDIYRLAEPAPRNQDDFWDEVVKPSPVPAARKDAQGAASWARKPDEPQIEAVCRHCDYSWTLGASNAGKVCLCENCGESITIPMLKQIEYAKRKQKQTRRNVIFWCVLGGTLLVLMVVKEAVKLSTPAGRAICDAEEFTKNLLKHPNTATLKERGEVVRTKPDGLYLIMVVWNAKNSFGVEDTVTFYVAVKVEKNLDSKVVDVSEGGLPLSW